MLNYDFKKDFSIFAHNPDVIYLDSAATSQKPQIVLLKEQQYKEFYCANTKRGSYEWSNKVDAAINNARSSVAKLINASSPDDIIFTSGATMSLNLVALCWAEHNLKDGDEILFCEKDHKSMVLPFKKLTKKVNLVPYNLDVSGRVDLNDLKTKITNKTKLVNLTHIHNVAGVANNIAEIKSLLPKNCALNIDAAQSISHVTTNVTTIDADFVSFSGHKMFASTGVGGLWVKPLRQNEFKPLFWGGEQNEHLAFYEKMECGTPNIAGIISLGEASNYIMNIGIATISQKIQNLSNHLFGLFLSHPRINLVYPTRVYELKHHYGILAFNIDGYEASDIGEYLSEHNICVRHGLHCNSSSENQESVRISLQFYNSTAEIDAVFELIKKLADS